MANEPSQVVSILCACVMAIISFTGCSTSRNQAVDESAYMRGPEKSEVHGEVGVMYGSNLGR